MQCSTSFRDGSFATDRCAMKIGLCPQCPESDGWPLKRRPSRRANSCRGHVRGFDVTWRQSRRRDMPNSPPDNKTGKRGSMKSFRTAAVGLAVLSAGCAGVASQQFNPQGEPLKTIALINVPNPAQYQAVDYGSKAGMFGAIGGAVMAAEAKTMSETLTVAAKEASFDYSREMQAAVAERLKRAGFKVVMVRAERDAPNALIADYGKVPAADADALLDIDARTVGYASYN